MVQYGWVTSMYNAIIVEFTYYMKCLFFLAHEGILAYLFTNLIENLMTGRE